MTSSPTPDPEERATRSYHSPRRQATADQTRARVLATASRLFASRGWTGTSIRDIAREAGVAVETVYAAAGTKRDLLLQVIDVAVVGDDAPVALAGRPQFTDLARGDRRARVDAAARLMTGLNSRVAGLNRALAHAAESDDQLATELAASRTRQRSTVAAGLDLVLGHPAPAALVEAIWALGHSDCYLLLVDAAGWTDEQYRSWLADAYDHQLQHLTEESS